MSEKHELPSDSDEGDEDYVPEEQDSVSEIESEGDVEASPNEDNNECQTDTNVRKRRKRCKNIKSKVSKRKHKHENPVAHDKEEHTEDATKEKIVNEEEEKKKADSLWADFMKDTGKFRTYIFYEVQSYAKVYFEFLVTGMCYLGN